MRVLVVGSGGREHALAWKLGSSPSLTELHAAPGTPASPPSRRVIRSRRTTQKGCSRSPRSLGVDLVVVGPEAPLVAGVADVLRHAGIPVFGPSAAAARIEGSKRLAKEVMAAVGVPTAALLDRPRAPCVLKADGLAAGKGVVVCRTEAELEAGSRRCARLATTIVVEELLEGPEVSVLALCDGTEPSRCRRRATSSGPSTATRARTPAAWARMRPSSGIDVDEVVATCVSPVLPELARRGTPFVGTLFVGLMLTADGPGCSSTTAASATPRRSPSCRSSRATSCRARRCRAAAPWPGSRSRSAPEAPSRSSSTAGGYPAAADRGTPIEGIERAEAAGALVFHSGTALRAGRLVTNGGRLLGVTATGSTLVEARRRAYEAADSIRIPGARRRADIALAAAADG